MSYYSALNEYEEFREYRPFHELRQGMHRERRSYYGTRTRPYYPAYHYQSSVQYNNYAQQYDYNCVPDYSNVPPYHEPYPQELFQPCSLTSAAVKFSEIPFYKPLHILLKPSIPVPGPFSRHQMLESFFFFRLSQTEIRDIACKDQCQIFMRFCKFVSESEQNDDFPPNLSVRVNKRPLPLEIDVAARTRKPLCITPFAKLSPLKDNEVTVSWSNCSNQSYAFTVYIAKPMSPNELLQNLKDNVVKISHLTTSMVIDKIKEERDLDIAVTSIKVSLLCPLGKTKMEFPCRATTCTHVACFDASLYINLQQNKGKWKWLCPICDKLALYKNLEIDELFMSILAKIPRDCTEVKFFEDGSWAPVYHPSPSKKVPQFIVETSESVEVIDIADSDTSGYITVD